MLITERHRYVHHTLKKSQILRNARNVWRFSLRLCLKGTFIIINMWIGRNPQTECKRYSFLPSFPEDEDKHHKHQSKEDGQDDRYNDGNICCKTGKTEHFKHRAHLLKKYLTQYWKKGSPIKIALQRVTSPLCICMPPSFHSKLF